MLKVIEKNLDPDDYGNYMNQSIDLVDIKKAFKHASVRFFSEKIPLWRELQLPLLKSGVSQRSINDGGVLVKDANITSAMLGEAVEYFCRSFYNFYAQDKLIEHYYATWSGVTNYYSSFFSLHSLLRLQGRAITSIWRNGKRFYIFPSNILENQYIICKEGVKGKTAHEAAWFLFYEVYDTFSYSPNVHFEAIFKKKNTGTIEEEIDFRTQKNYEPYEAYEEIRDLQTLQDMLDNYENKRFTSHDIEVLSGLATDPYYRYYARSVMRIVFACTLLEEIAENNGDLKTLLSERRIRLSEFLKKTNLRKNKDMICCRLRELLNLEA